MKIEKKKKEIWLVYKPFNYLVLNLKIFENFEISKFETLKKFSNFKIFENLKFKILKI